MTMLSVDTKGLRALQEGKPKTFIINELTQNAWDEDIKYCKLDISYKDGLVTLIVEDDSPEGFKDLRHAFTLFADTYKRKDATKRGRFNLGEKQVVVCSESTVIETTKGTVIFNVENDDRQETDDKRAFGTVVTVLIKATEDEFEEMLEHTNLLLPPKHIKFIVNGKKKPSKSVVKTFDVSLDTELLVNDAMVTTSRVTDVNILESDGQSFIYEMGIPVVKTDCIWNIDIQQKVPLAIDRETIRPYYLQDLYAVVVNNAYEIIPEENCSDVWVRSGIKDERIRKEAVGTILNNRFGDKFLSANPFDPNANDEALSHGFNIIHGNEMSKEEWAKARELGLIKSTSDLFSSRGLMKVDKVKPNEEQERYAMFAKKVAKKFLGVDLTVHFVRAKGTPVRACYENENKQVYFNLAHPTVGNGYFDELNWNNLRLLIHELGHEKGNHTEKEYHYCLTKLGSQLVMEAIGNPDFFEMN